MINVFIGIVEKGMFRQMFPEPDNLTQLRLTTSGVEHSVPPENGELNLVEFEEAAIAVEGHANGEWIYSAKVVDTGEPIVTALVKKVFPGGHRF